MTMCYGRTVLADSLDRFGSVFGRWCRVDALWGSVEMAEVYRAEEDETNTAVALKILRRSLAGDPAIAQRFSREAEVQAKLRHRNVAALLATGVTDQDEPYLVVELLHGRNLRHALRSEGRLPPRRAASYAWQALQGLGAVHQLGVLHRDL